VPIKNLGFISALLAVQLFAPLHSEIIGLIGGDDSNGPYAAFVFSDGALTRLPTMAAPGGNIMSASIGKSFIGLIGGSLNAAATIPYAEIVLPNGTLINLTPNLPAAGSIRGVSVNNAGFGLIGGQGVGLSAYAAFVSPTGTISSFGSLPALGLIDGVSINDFGNGILGGRSAIGGVPYAAFIASDGTLTSIDTSGFPAGGTVVSVAINSSGAGLIGGGSIGGISAAFAAFVTPGGSVTPLPVILGPSSRISGVSMNDSGQGIIGGFDFTGPIFSYAALVSPDGSLLTLAGVPNPGSIDSVAINSSGVGIIGGGIGIIGMETPYAAFVGVDGAVAPLSLSLSTGVVSSVAINDSGIGLIGGGDGAMQYSALVAPNGTVTLLHPLAIGGHIGSVSLIFDAMTPSSVGPYSSAINSALSASNALNAHISVLHKRLGLDDELGYRTDVAALIADAAFGETADAGDGLTPERQVSFLRSSIAKTKQPETHCSKIGNCTAFIIPFYDHIHQKADRNIPAFTNDIGGALAAMEYTSVNDMILGGGLSYAFNYTHYSRACP